MSGLKRIDIILAMVLFSMAIFFSAKYVSADAVVDSGSCGPALTYTLYDDGVLDVEGKGKLRNPWVPSNTYTEWEPPYIVKVILPQGVTEICSCAFRKCSFLSSIEIPDSVTIIGERSFSLCKALKNITIPGSVTQIDYSAFMGCSALESITLKEGLTSIGGDAFTACTALEKVVFPKSVTSIGAAAFSECTSLAELTLPKGVSEIEAETFAFCSALANIVIPDSVNKIGSSAFKECTALTSVVIPGSVNEIGKDAFTGCSLLEDVIIKEGTSIIKSYAFSSCTSLKNITIPRSVTYIGRSVFSQCPAMTIYGYAGSYAETYAKNNKIPFVPIQPKRVTGIKLDKTSGIILTTTSALLPGQTVASLKLQATVSPADADNIDVEWASSDESIASVDPSGKVKGLKAGTVTIAATTVDGGKTATCKLQVMTRKEVALKAGAVYIFKSKLSNNYSMDVMYANSATNSNVSLYKTDTKRAAERFTVQSKKANGKTCYLLTRKNSTVGSRALTELKGKNLVFAANKGTNWQLFRAYQFNDGTVQFINRGSNNAIAVVGGTAANRVNIAPAKADLSNGQRWKCVKVG